MSLEVRPFSSESFSNPGDFQTTKADSYGRSSQYTTTVIRENGVPVKFSIVLSGDAEKPEVQQAHAKALEVFARSIGNGKTDSFKGVMTRLETNKSNPELGKLGIDRMEIGNLSNENW